MARLEMGSDRPGPSRCRRPQRRGQLRVSVGGRATLALAGMGRLDSSSCHRHRAEVNRAGGPARSCHSEPRRGPFSPRPRDHPKPQLREAIRSPARARAGQVVTDGDRGEVAPEDGSDLAPIPRAVGGHGRTRARARGVIYGHLMRVGAEHECPGMSEVAGRRWWLGQVAAERTGVGGATQPIPWWTFVKDDGPGNFLGKMWPQFCVDSEWPGVFRVGPPHRPSLFRFLL
jgi:hypothetical protein